jgi:hypothetical protein
MAARRGHMVSSACARLQHDCYDFSWKIAQSRGEHLPLTRPTAAPSVECRPCSEAAREPTTTGSTSWLMGGRKREEDAGQLQRLKVATALLPATSCKN